MFIGWFSEVESSWTTNSLKCGERSDREDDVDHPGDERAGSDPPEDRDRVLHNNGMAVVLLASLGLLTAFFGLCPRPHKQYGLRGDGLHAVVHHKAHVHDAVGPVGVKME